MGDCRKARGYPLDPGKEDFPLLAFFMFVVKNQNRCLLSF